MPVFIHATCVCGRQVRAKVEQAGSTVRCWGCRNDVSIPIASDFGRIARAYVDALRESVRGESLLLVLAGALALTLVLSVPRVGGWLGLAALVGVAWRYLTLIGDSSLSVSKPDPVDAGTRPAQRPLAIRMALAVLAAGTLVAPFLARNGGQILPQNPPNRGSLGLMAMAFAAWLVVPLILLSSEARDRRGLLPVSLTLATLKKHPSATLAALFVVPLGFLVLEGFIALFTTYQGNLGLTISDLFPIPRTVPSKTGTLFKYRFDDLTAVADAGGEFSFIPTYLKGLRRGFTLVGTIPASMTQGASSRVETLWFLTDRTYYLGFRAVTTFLILAGAGVVLAVQARWLGLVAAIGAGRTAVSPARVPASVPIPQVVETPRPEALNGRAASVEPSQSNGFTQPEPVSASILIIDDERQFTEAIGRILASRGFAVRVAVSAADGLQQALAVRPDLIVLDLLLPDRPGHEVCRELRAAASTRNVPILIATYLSTTEDEIAGLTEGADDFIAKPYVIEVLIARMRNLLNRRA